MNLNFIKVCGQGVSGCIWLHTRVWTLQLLKQYSYHEAKESTLTFSNQNFRVILLLSCPGSRYFFEYAYRFIYFSGAFLLLFCVDHDHDHVWSNHTLVKDNGMNLILR